MAVIVKPLHSLGAISVAESQKKILTKKTFFHRLKMMAVQAVPSGQQLPSKVNQIHSCRISISGSRSQAFEDKEEALA